MNKLKLLKTGILLLTLFSANGAQGISLSDLLQGSSITVNDKLFDRWTFSQTASDDTFLLNAANIEVSGLPATGTNLLDPGPGLAFDIIDGATVTGNGSYAYLDFTIGFMASVLSGSPYDIKDVSLDLLTASLSGDQNLGVSIKEDVYNTANNLLATTDVNFGLFNKNLSANFSNSIAFPSHKSISVTKNVLVWSTASGETATLFDFEQHFSQVPEPEVLLMLTIGLAGAGITRMRRV